MAAKIRKGDKVMVMTGRDKGRTGEVFEVRTTMARKTSPFFTRPRGMASFTDTTITSPTLA